MDTYTNRNGNTCLVYRIDDELDFDEIKALFYIQGMETWSGKEIAFEFNNKMDLQIEYIEDSIWKVTKEDDLENERMQAELDWNKDNIYHQ